MDLSVGMSGKDVEILQGLLKAQGYSIATDGVYGPITEKAVFSYQLKMGLRPTGIASDETLAKLRGQPPIPPNDPLMALTKGTKQWYEAAFKVVEYDHGFEAQVNDAALRVYGGKYFYWAKGVSLEIKDWEYANIKLNPKLYYFSTALKLHHRINKVLEVTTPAELPRR